MLSNLEKNGTQVNYVEDANQDVLFPFLRYSTEVQINKKHGITFLLQPLDISTKALLIRNIRIDNAVFAGKERFNPI